MTADLARPRPQQQRSLVLIQQIDVGVIEAMSNATGAQYSIVPQDNATGNLVKVEQRLPVKIRFTKENSKENIRRLRAGLNVECEMID